MFTTEDYNVDWVTTSDRLPQSSANTSLGDNLSMPTLPQTTGLFEEDDTFLSSNPTMAITYLTAVGLALTVGTFGNLVLIGSTLVHQKLRVAGYELVINMALADLCVTAVADPMCALGVIHGKKWFDARPSLCVGIASMCLGACFCAFFSLTALTINRVVFIFKREYYTDIYTPKKIITCCIFIWVLSFAFEVPNFFGWGGHYFDEKNMQCIWDRTGSESYTLFVAIFLILSPLAMMSLAYFCIFVKIYRAKSSMNSHQDTEPGKKNPLKEAIRSCRSLVVIVVAFIVCWTPYAVIISVDVADKLPFWVHIWATFLAHSHSTLNFFIYGFTNPHYRDGYRKFLRIDCSCNPKALTEKRKEKKKSDTSAAAKPNHNPLSDFDSSPGESIDTTSGTKTKDTYKSDTLY